VVTQFRLTTCAESDTIDGFVVVDSVVEGRAMGGIRMTPGVTLSEVASLASRMTLKLALADVAMGGAKAGIVSRLPLGPERDRQLALFGSSVAPLLHGGVYLGSDQGVSHRDRDIILDAAGYDVCQQPQASLPCDWTGLWERCEDVTGFGVGEAIAAAVDTAQPRDGHLTAAIQGFGAVGRGVATALERRGYRVVAAADRDGTVSCPTGLPIAPLIACTDRTGTIDRRRLPSSVQIPTGPEAWLDVPADVLVLAAGGDAIRADNQERVRAPIVVEGGNLSCSTEAHALLAARGVPVLPDIVVNSGGATVTGLVLSGATPRDLTTDQLVRWLYEQVSARIRRSTTALLERGVRSRRPLPEVANEVAMERISSAAPSLAGR
jgi:glutamate dehydrogenase (NAD(P)+)